ncbi:MAG: DNA-directed RNA polymerase subunit beta, partial [Candidatus Saccharicenans sp.]|nr:DNA-directed RNA polymerase subunit beta [Candidatus Saccharicenans sp.]
MLDQNHNIYRERVDFSKIKTVFELPDLLEIQRKSYDEFLQMDLLPEERKEVGLQAAFKDVFPITDFKETTELQFLSYTIGDWECKCGRLKGVENSRPRCLSCGALLPSEVALQEKKICPYCGEHKKIEMPLCDYCGDRVRLKIKYSPLECIQKGYTYEAPLKLKVQLVSWEKDPATKTRRLKHIKQQEVYFGNIPLMTDKGTFIFNGVERVVVSQLQRSPGVFFRPGEIKGQFVGKVIPYRGAWVEFENDTKNILWVRLDRKKKFLATVFLRALGYGSDEEIIKLFFKSYELIPEDGKLYWKVTDSLVGKVLREDVYSPESSRVPVVRAGARLDQELINKLLEKNVTRIKASRQDLQGACSLVNVRGKIKAGEELTAEQLENLTTRGEPFEVFFPAEDEAAQMILNTLKKDLKKDQQQALSEIYKKLRPGEPHTAESARALFDNMFFNPQKFNFSRIGRLKFNIKLGLESGQRDVLLETERKSGPEDPKDRLLSKEDYVQVIKYLLKLKNGEGSVDDIDHL